MRSLRFLDWTIQIVNMFYVRDLELLFQWVELDHIVDKGSYDIY